MTNKVIIESDVRQWFYFPIPMLLNNGQGPANIKEADEESYEVWDKNHNSYGSFSNIYDAINLAIKLNLELSKEQT